MLIWLNRFVIRYDLIEKLLNSVDSDEMRQLREKNRFKTSITCPTDETFGTLEGII